MTEVGDRLEQAIEHHADVPARARARRARGAPARQRSARTVFWLAVSGVSMYLVAPSLIAALGSWRQIERLSPPWLAAMAALQAAALFCLWAPAVPVAARRAGSR